MTVHAFCGPRPVLTADNSFFDIAAKYGITLADLFGANPQVNSSLPLAAYNDTVLHIPQMCGGIAVSPPVTTIASTCSVFWPIDNGTRTGAETCGTVALQHCDRDLRYLSEINGGICPAANVRIPMGKRLCIAKKASLVSNKPVGRRHLMLHTHHEASRGEVGGSHGDLGLPSRSTLTEAGESRRRLQQASGSSSWPCTLKIYAADGVSCGIIMTTYKLSHDTLVSYNPGLDCAVLAAGTELCVERLEGGMEYVFPVVLVDENYVEPALAIEQQTSSPPRPPSPLPPAPPPPPPSPAAPSNPPPPPPPPVVPHPPPPSPTPPPSPLPSSSSPPPLFAAPLPPAAVAAPTLPPAPIPIPIPPPPPPQQQQQQIVPPPPLPPSAAAPTAGMPTAPPPPSPPPANDRTASTAVAPPPLQPPAAPSPPASASVADTAAASRRKKAASKPSPASPTPLTPPPSPPTPSAAGGPGRGNRRARPPPPAHPSPPATPSLLPAATRRNNNNKRTPRPPSPAPKPQPPSPPGTPSVEPKRKRKPPPPSAA